MGRRLRPGISMLFPFALQTGAREAPAAVTEQAVDSVTTPAPTAEEESTGGEPLPDAAAPSPEGIMAKAGSENFPVASRLLPGRLRRHLLAIYGFARLVDDIGDEATGDRLALLDALERDLDRLYAGETPHNQLVRRLGPTVRECAIPPEPFRRLIAANRQDQVVTTYATFDDLLAYCELSANPVGHLVLHVVGRATPVRLRLSDRICTGLQLTEHWQDVSEDLARGRVYIPQEDLERFGCSPDDLRRRPASPAFRALMSFEVTRARELLHDGGPLVRALRGHPRLAVAGFVAGGRAALDAIERAGCDVMGGAPRPSRGRQVVELGKVLAEARGWTTA